jgi:hypothetical protein
MRTDREGPCGCATATGVAVDAKGYCAAAEDNLIDAVTPELWLAAKADLEGGKGSELGGKFRAAHSSSALVAHTFVPMRDGVDIPGVGLCAGLPRLEQERSSGAKGYNPTLDVIVEGEGRDLYSESKCREYLDSGEADFSDAWPKLAAEHLSSAAARKLRRRVRDGALAFGAWSGPADGPALGARCEFAVCLDASELSLIAIAAEFGAPRMGRDYVVGVCRDAWPCRGPGAARSGIGEVRFLGPGEVLVGPGQRSAGQFIGDLLHPAQLCLGDRQLIFGLEQGDAWYHRRVLSQSSPQFADRCAQRSRALIPRAHAALTGPRWARATSRTTVPPGTSGTRCGGSRA